MLAIFQFNEFFFGIANFLFMSLVEFREHYDVSNKPVLCGQ